MSACPCRVADEATRGACSQTSFVKLMTLDSTAIIDENLSAPSGPTPVPAAAASLGEGSDKVGTIDGHPL